MPYTFSSYKTIEAAKKDLYCKIQLEIERGRSFYVDNDFFDNKYALGSNLFYMCIMERNVDEWKKYSQSESNEENNNKIKYIFNFK